MAFTPIPPTHEPGLTMVGKGPVVRTGVLDLNGTSVVVGRGTVTAVFAAEGDTTNVVAAIAMAVLG